MTTISRDKSIFHPMEISICGFSGTGKTTLITKLIKKFTEKNRSVGFLKHDAHQFEMDKEGKDTYLARKSGATSIGISSSLGAAFITDNFNLKFKLRSNLIESDLVFIEGYKDELCQKLLMWSGTREGHELLKVYKKNEKHKLIALIGSEARGPVSDIPYFQRDDVDSIFEFIEKRMAKSILQRPLYGLILAGGQSKRMGQDKVKLNYNGSSQALYLSNLLEQYTKKTFLSCRPSQRNQNHLQGLNLIEDRFVDFGPMGGILSAFKAHPEAAWLVVACDMPFIDSLSVQELIEQRDPFKVATCFYNRNKGWREPLFSIYEPKAAQIMGQYLAMNVLCPRSLVKNANVKEALPTDSKVLDNINTYQEFKDTKKRFNTDRGIQI